ncbi:MAG: CBS domain-containing protein [Rhodothermales bacterium]
MTIQTLISEDTPPIRPGDTVEHALGLLLEMRVRHLPVVDDEGVLVGMVSENMLLDAFGPDAPVSSLLGLAPISVRPDTHIFDATKVIVDHELTALPVARENGQYVGMVKRHNLFDQFARMLATQERGAIIALEVNPRDYSLAQLAHIVEQNGVKILSSAAEHTAAGEEGDTMRVTLKLNVMDTSRVRHLLEHYGYHIVAYFSDDQDDDEFKYRLQEFMRYLEV